MAKNILVTGGLGQVSIGIVEILLSHPEYSSFLNKDRQLFLLDIVENPDTKKLDFLSHKYIHYIHNDYLYNLEDIILDNEIDTIIHLIPNSCLPIWNVIEKIPYRVNYIDASVYILNYHSDFLYPDHLLLSNFHYFDYIKHEYPSVKGISSSGMNPGIVNYLFEKFIRKYGAKNLKAAYVIENDSYKLKNRLHNDKIYVTWGGDACPAECIENPIWFKNSLPYTYKGTRACDIRFKFNMKGKDYKGMAVIHEECFSLSKRYNIETTFLYSLPEKLMDKIKRYKNGKDDSLSSKDVEVLSPLNYELEGEDTLGIKLVYKDKEVNITNTTGNKKYVSGVTYQVSCGVFAALMLVLENEDSINSIDWIDHFLKDKSLFRKYGRILNSLLEFDEEVLDFSDGLLKDRVDTDGLLESLIAPDERAIKAIDSNGINDVFWSQIEYELIKKFGSDKLYIINAAYIEAYRRYKYDGLLESKDEILKNAINFIAKAIDSGYRFLTIEYHRSLGDVEYLLLNEGVNLKTAHKFMSERFMHIKNLEIKSEEDLWNGIYKLYYEWEK